MVQRWQGEEGVEGIEERQSKEDTKEMEKEVLINFSNLHVIGTSSSAIECFSPARVDALKLCCVNHEEVENSIEHHHTPKRCNQMAPERFEHLTVQ